MRFIFIRFPVAIWNFPFFTHIFWSLNQRAAVMEAGAFVGTCKVIRLWSTVGVNLYIIAYIYFVRFR